jgi:xanthine dehydrogenase YagR molybdenum-binding subunit
MPDYTWPDAQHWHVLGTRVKRVDGPVKVTGAAKYTYDVNRPGMLYGRIVRSTYPHCKITSIDTSAAEAMPGVKAVYVAQGPDKEIHWAGDELVGVAAVDERTADDAARAVKVEYQQLPFLVVDETIPQNIEEGAGPLTPGDIEDAVDNQVPDNVLIQQIQQNGVAFQMTPELEKMARDNGVSDPVIAALKSAQYHPEAANRPKPPYKKAAAVAKGDPNAMQQAEVTSEGTYGAPVITHCCLESHGAIVEWTDDQNLLVHISTQNVSGIAGQLADSLNHGGLNVQAANIRVHQDHIGGGFGSKFAPDRWTVIAAQLSKKAGGKPVKIMLDRSEELRVAGARPSAFARVKVGAKRDGTLVAWDSQSWGTGGPGGGGEPPLPYVFNIPNQRRQHVSVATNIGPARAWRAPNHPQAAVLTMCALDDLAARLNMNPMDLWLKNMALTGPRAQIYTDELKIGDQLMGWRQRWHPRGDKAAGPVKQGLGLSCHTWGGRGHESNCDVTIHPDGSVEIKMGSQDLGTGTRTAILMVASETLGVPISNIKLLIGDSSYPKSGGSGGSTTIGGVSSSTRRGTVDARDKLLAKVAPALGSTPDQLEAVNGKIQVKGNAGKSMSWKDACAKMGATPITARGINPGPEKLTDSGVGGITMADVSVDTETGIVTVNKMVAVQDCGLVVSLTTAESQCLGALIMGISYALYEEKVMDPTTGVMLNPNMEFYRLAGIGDIPELVVHMMTGPGPLYDGRGVIGLGEPPVISPGAAISNAVANAIGVRVPNLPLTPDRVLAALQGAQQGRSA